MKKYFIATRPWSFPVSSMSVLVTASGLFFLGYPVNWYLTLWAVIGIILFHAASNVLSDYYDFRKGVDQADTFGSRTLTDHILTPQQVFRLGWILTAVACLNGLAMAYVSGAQLLIYGAIGLVLSLIYPWLKYHALGDLDIFLEYGIIPALGTSFFVTGTLQVDALWFVLAYVTITMGVLHANNTRDIQPDRRAKIATLPMLIGKKGSIILYGIMVYLPVVWISLCCVWGKMPWWCMLSWLTIAMITPLFLQMRRFLTDDQAINDLDEKTAKLQLIHCLLLVITLIVGTVV